MENLSLNLRLRIANRGDLPALQALVDAAVRELGGRDYAPEQIETALQGVFGADTAALIADETYYVMEAEGQIVGAGGWSQRQSLHGGDHAGLGAALDPARDPAKIRAYYVHPQWARRGIARRLLRCSEQAARAAGFGRLEVLSTLTGVPLYTAAGFTPVRDVALALPDGQTLPCVYMTKNLPPQGAGTAAACG